MRAILPGGVRVDWTPDEVAEAMRILTQSMLDAARGRESSGLTLANPLIVRYEDRQTKLTSTQHALLRYVLSHGATEFETLIEAVWFGKPVSDANLRKVCSDISTRFFDADIPYSLSAKAGVIELVKEP